MPLGEAPARHGGHLADLVRRQGVHGSHQNGPVRRVGVDERLDGARIEGVAVIDVGGLDVVDHLQAGQGNGYVALGFGRAQALVALGGGHRGVDERHRRVLLDRRRLGRTGRGDHLHARPHGHHGHRLHDRACRGVGGEGEISSSALAARGDHSP